MTGDTWRSGRKAVLETLREKLINEVNPVKKVGKCPYYYRSKTKWKEGDLLAYRILEDFSCMAKGTSEVCIKMGECIERLKGKYVLLRVVENKQRPVTDMYPELDYMSWSNVMLKPHGKWPHTHIRGRHIPFR